MGSAAALLLFTASVVLQKQSSEPRHEQFPHLGLYAVLRAQEKLQEISGGVCEQGTIASVITFKW